MGERPNPYQVGYEVLNEVSLGLIDHQEALGAISDAFVPPHHAVYDTRTQVVVPIATICDIDRAIGWCADTWADLEDDNDYYRMSDGRMDGKDAIELRDAALVVRSLIPESDAP